MAIDSRYIPAFSIEDVLLDKDTGAPLSGGLVYFEQDNQRGVLKPVYQITGTSPNYIYTQLPNPMTLSSIGTFEDALSNPVVPYFFPYDANGDVEYYYVRVTSSDDVPQFAREAVPYVGSQDNAEVLSVITNELSNPQFVEVKFDTSNGAYTYSFTGATDQVVSIAPDWDLIVTAPTTGTVTVTQLTPAGSLNIITNPGTLLTITSAGITKLQLRQRIYGSPNLWGSGYLSGTFVAKTYSGTSVTLNMYYSQSNGVVVDQLLVSALLPASGNYEQFPGSFFIPPSTSNQSFPTAYVDIYFDIPLSVQIDITSVMVAYTGTTSIADINYDQESLARQIDHLYHYAYPIVPIGSVIDFAGFPTPLHYYLCDGSAKNRISDWQLFNALTFTSAITLTTSVATFTVVSNTNLHIGMKLEGNGVQAGTTITNIVGLTVTMSLPATITGATTMRFFAWGNGDGSTTFNVPNLQGFVTAGANGTVLGAGVVNGVGLTGGASTVTLTINEMPNHNHPGSTTTADLGTPMNSGGGAALRGVVVGGWPVQVAPQGGGLPHNNVQPTALVKKYIRYQ
jgi:hypothetical protein